ncbi:hypothetical protein Tco_0707564 [Tanacetum coccineum]|uniref:Uncharacterized protein n=1 Tax=Tanacetum coccineum TaxID=301880 RepID=A0ABQ4YC30_9ASTR
MTGSYLILLHQCVANFTALESKKRSRFLSPVEKDNTSEEIILRRADYQEYKISEKDFKNLHPNDFEDLFLLNIQEKLNHLPKTDKTSLHTAVNMWIRNLPTIISRRYTIVTSKSSCRQRRINLRKLMRLIELHRAWRPGSGQRMTREEAKTSSQLSRKDYRSEGSFRSLESFVEEEIRYIDYRDLQNKRDASSVQSNGQSYFLRE